MVAQANHVNVHNDQNGGIFVTDEQRNEFERFWQEYKENPLEGRNLIIASMCPQIFGCYVVKLAVTLVVIGGVRRVDQTGTKVRGESHLLLVGDPGRALHVVFCNNFNSFCFFISPKACHDYSILMYSSFGSFLFINSFKALLQEYIYNSSVTFMYDVINVNLVILILIFLPAV